MRKVTVDWVKEVNPIEPRYKNGNLILNMSIVYILALCSYNNSNMDSGDTYMDYMVPNDRRIYSGAIF